MRCVPVVSYVAMLLPKKSTRRMVLCWGRLTCCITAWGNGGCRPFLICAAAVNQHVHRLTLTQVKECGLSICNGWSSCLPCTVHITLMHTPAVIASVRGCLCLCNPARGWLGMGWVAPCYLVPTARIIRSPLSRDRVRSSINVKVWATGCCGLSSS